MTAAGGSCRFHLVRLAAPGPEREQHFETINALAAHILGQLTGPHVWLGDAHMVICALGRDDRVERDACYVAHCDAAGVRGAAIGFAVLPFEPARGSFGARPALAAALRKLAPTVKAWREAEPVAA